MTTPSHAHRNARLVTDCARRCTSPVHPSVCAERRLCCRTRLAMASGTPSGPTGAASYAKPTVSEPLSMMAERRGTTGGEAGGEGGGWDMAGGRVSGRAGGRVGDQAATGGHFGWQRPVGHTCLPPLARRWSLRKKKIGGRGDRPTRPEKKSWSQPASQPTGRVDRRWVEGKHGLYTTAHVCIKFGVGIGDSLCLNLAIGEWTRGRGGWRRPPVGRPSSRKKNSAAGWSTSPPPEKKSWRPDARPSRRTGR